MHEARTLERLTNKKLVVRDGHVVTTYSSRSDDQKRHFVEVGGRG